MGSVTSSAAAHVAGPAPGSGTSAPENRMIRPWITTTISRVMTNSLTRFWLGSVYMASSSSSSMIIIRPRAPTLRS